jgi:hypothetical protein
MPPRWCCSRAGTEETLKEQTADLPQEALRWCCCHSLMARCLVCLNGTARATRPLVSHSLQGVCMCVARVLAKQYAGHAMAAAVHTVRSKPTRTDELYTAETTASATRVRGFQVSPFVAEHTQGVNTRALNEPPAQPTMTWWNAVLAQAGEGPTTTRVIEGGRLPLLLGLSSCRPQPHPFLLQCFLSPTCRAIPGAPLAARLQRQYCLATARASLLPAAHCCREGHCITGRSHHHRHQGQASRAMPPSFNLKTRQAGALHLPRTCPAEQLLPRCAS